MAKTDIVWVIDDDQSIRWVLQKALEQAGFSVRSFDTANEMDDLLERAQPNAIVTDIRQVGSQLQVGLRFTDDTPGTAIRLAGTPLGAVPGDRVTVSWDPEHQAVVPFDNPIAGPAQGIHNATEPSAHQSEHHKSSITPHLTDPVSDLTS